jgi:hypothetical protein
MKPNSEKARADRNMFLRCVMTRDAAQLASRVSEKIALMGMKGEHGGDAIFSDTLPLNEAAFAALGVWSFTREKYASSLTRKQYPMGDSLRK